MTQKANTTAKPIAAPKTADKATNPEPVQTEIRKGTVRIDY